jgi:hypothetical protein
VEIGKAAHDVDDRRDIALADGARALAEGVQVVARVAALRRRRSGREEGCGEGHGEEEASAHGAPS